MGKVDLGGKVRGVEAAPPKSPFSISSPRMSAGEAFDGSSVVRAVWFGG